MMESPARLEPEALLISNTAPMKYNGLLLFWLLQLFFLSVFGQQVYKIGDLYTAPDGNMGVVFYVFPDNRGGWVVALNDAEGTFKWRDSAGVNISPDSFALMNPDAILDYQQDTAGYQNTQFLRNFGSGVADAVDLDHGWYVPAAKQLSMLFSQLPFVEPVLQQYGTILALNYYWSSTIHITGTAYALNAGVSTSASAGALSQRMQAEPRRVRAVRTFQHNGIHYDTTLTYQWNTGSTETHITPSPTQTTTYRVTATNETGCSAIASQTIFVLENAPQDFYDVVCQGEPYDANGFTVTAEETATPGLLTRTCTVIADGCTSVLTLYLTVLSKPVTELSMDACLFYVWNGMTYYESGDYEQHFLSADGCDSTVVLHLDLFQPDTAYLTVSVCDSYALNNVTYYYSGEYIQNLTNVNGCDSVIMLDLTIYPSHHITVDTVRYNELSWGDSLWTNTGTYRLAYTNQYGCDSIVTIHLIVIQRDSVFVDSTVCGNALPLIWNGMTFMDAGRQIATLHPAEHHDSVVVMTLHVFPTQHTHLDSTVCNTFEWDGENYSISGNYTKTFINQNGCDSVVTFHLTVHSSQQTQFTESACDSYIWNGQPYTQSGTYTQEFVNQYGCDSIVTAHLTVHHSDSIRIDTIVCPQNLPVTLHGFTFTGAGTQRETFTNSFGCDSLVVVHVDLSDTGTVLIDTAVCNYLYWRGIFYSESGIYERRFTNGEGCSYLCRMNLTVHQRDTTYLDTTVCQSKLPLRWHGRIFNASGTANTTLRNMYGCDSVLMMTVNVSPSSFTSFDTTVCESFEWNGSTYIRSGVYYQTFQNVAGCDSSVMAYVTVLTLPVTHFDTVVCADNMPIDWHGLSFTHPDTQAITYTSSYGMAKCTGRTARSRNDSSTATVATA